MEIDTNDKRRWLTDVIAVHYGFTSLSDVRPLVLMEMIVSEADAILALDPVRQLINDDTKWRWCYGKQVMFREDLISAAVS